MHLVQILLPVFDQNGNRLPEAEYGRVRGELTQKFGGLTAFTSAPAEGVWRTEGRTDRDEIIVIEVMTEELDKPWWGHYRRKLEDHFRQESIVVRAQPIELL